jgi:hypothetical protein
VRPPRRQPGGRRERNGMASVPRSGGGRQPRRRRRPRMSAPVVRDVVREIAALLDVYLSRREAVAFLRCWNRAAAGDPMSLRRLVRRWQQLDTRVRHRPAEPRTVLRDRQGRIVMEAWSWDPSPEEVPPAVAGAPRGAVASWRPDFPSPRAEVLGLTAWLLDRLAQQNVLQQMRALFTCARCGILTVSEDGRRDRGPRRVCEPCRPLERRDNARQRQAWARARRRTLSPRRSRVSRGKSLLLSR